MKKKTLTKIKSVLRWQACQKLRKISWIVRPACLAASKFLQNVLPDTAADLKNTACDDIKIPLQLCRDFFRKPKISILIPVYNTGHNGLKSCINSVLNQSYTNWELCVVDDGSDDLRLKEILMDFARQDSRIKVSFSTKNQGIALTINSASKMASGKYLGILDHDDELHPDALAEYVKTFNRNHDADLLYCDEDKIDDSGICFDPWFKSDWNPDLSLSFNFVMHFVIVRRDIFEKIGGVRPDYEGSQDFDMLLRVSELTDKIYHIPQILYHWRTSENSIATGPEAKPEIFQKGLNALSSALRRRGIDAKAEPAPDAWPGVFRVRRKILKKYKISIIIKICGDNAGLQRLLDSMPFAKNLHYEIVVLHSHEVKFPANLIAHDDIDIIHVHCETQNSYPKSFNLGAKAANGDFLFFTDDTLEILNRDSILELAAQAQRQEVGVAAGKVYYQDGLVEHAGAIIGVFGSAGYSHRATPDDWGYVGIKNMICNYSAVMGLGMMTNRRIFLENQGFDESFKQAFWDIDFCLRLRDKNFLITYTTYSKILHHIPVKSIQEMTPEADTLLFRDKWEKYIEHDPFFNPNLARHREDFNFEHIDLCS